MKRQTSLILSTILLAGCSTPTKSTLLGLGVGAAAGGLLGSLANQHIGDQARTNGTFVGASVGAAAGGLLAYLGHKKEEEKKAKMLRTPTMDKSEEGKTPSLTVPEVRRIWVPDKIEGNKYEEGHYIYVIERQSVWSK